MSTVMYLCYGCRCERSCICTRGIDVNGRVFVLGCRSERSCICAMGIDVNGRVFVLGESI